MWKKCLYPPIDTWDDFSFFQKKKCLKFLKFTEICWNLLNNIMFSKFQQISEIVKNSEIYWNLLKITDQHGQHFSVNFSKFQKFWQFWNLLKNADKKLNIGTQISEKKLKFHEISVFPQRLWNGQNFAFWIGYWVPNFGYWVPKIGYRNLPVL